MKNSQMEELVSLNEGLVVEKKEILDPEDGEVEFSLMFAADSLKEHGKSTMIQVTTDDRAFYSKFCIAEKYDMTFLKESKVSVMAKSN